VFFIFDQNIKKEGKLSVDFWYRIFINFMFLDSKNQIRVLNLIQRNKFFNFYPNFAIQAAKEFFLYQQELPDEFFFYTKSSPKTLYNLLTLLELEVSEVDFLIYKTLQIKDFSIIIEFISNKHLAQPNLTDKKDLALLLTKFGLIEHNKNFVLNNIS